MTEVECQVAAFVRYKTDQCLDYIPQTVTQLSLFQVCLQKTVKPLDYQN